MSVSQLIAEPLLIYKASKSSTDLGKEVGRLMDTVGLARRFANSYPHELDGGRRQRIGIARALSLTRNSSSAMSRFPRLTFPFRHRF